MPIIPRHDRHACSRPDALQTFIRRWQGVTASALSSAQSFVIGLCASLGVVRPQATAEMDDMVERPIAFRHADGSPNPGRVDCYRRGAFVLDRRTLHPGQQALKGQTTKGFDDALLRARSQAEHCARPQPGRTLRPPAARA